MKRLGDVLPIVFSVLVVVTVATFSSAAHAVESRQPHTYRVTLKVSGDEYESADGAALNGSDGTQCPTTKDVPSVRARCWSWVGTRLGHGTYVHATHYEPPDRILGTITLTGSHGAVLNVAGDSQVIEDPTPPSALGHVNRFPGTLTFTTGTGRYKNITGTLTGTFKSTVAAVDPNTGIVHRRVAGKHAGKLTFQ